MTTAAESVLLTVHERRSERVQRAGLAVVVATRTRWSLERQVRLGAGLLLLLTLALTELVDDRWLLLTALVAAGLTFAGITDICLLGNVLSRMPWNQPRAARKKGIYGYPG